MRQTNVDDLRVMVAIDRLGSLSAAARELGMSQQAVSQRMSALERAWRLQLFVRGARGTTFTDHGRLVVNWARQLLDQVAGFEASVDSLTQSQRSRLKVAASLTIAEHLIPAWLIALRKAAPGVSVELAAVNSVAVIEAVRKGRVDLGFVETPDVPQDVTATHLGSDEVVVVVAPGHPWASRSLVSPSEVAATGLISRESGSGTRRTLELALADAGVTGDIAPPAAVLATTAGIRATVLAGSGAAALSLRAVIDDVRAGSLRTVPVDMPAMTRPLKAIRRQGQPLSEAGEALLGIAVSWTHAHRVSKFTEEVGNQGRSTAV